MYAFFAAFDTTLRASPVPSTAVRVGGIIQASRAGAGYTHCRIRKRSSKS